MSVAFRRDSDEEHKEPKFELPLPPGPNLVTQRGLALIDATVTALKEQISASGDEAQGEALKRDLRYWHTRQTTAIVAPTPQCDSVAFGVRVEIMIDGNRRLLDLVGSDEADRAAGRVAFTAPLARAVMGAGVGDFCDFGGVDMAIEVLAITPIPQ
jgi:transcription elongation GreA/GreB family factor